MYKMKIIDLLCKIANGEELPTEVEFKGVRFKWDGARYIEYGKEEEILDYLLGTEFNLNLEVKIIGSYEGIKPLKELRVIQDATENESALFAFCCDLQNKQAEIIKSLNELKGGSNGNC